MGRRAPVPVPWLNLSDDNVRSCFQQVHFKGTAASVVSPRVMGSGGEAFGWATRATAANLRIIPAIAEARFGPPFRGASARRHQGPQVKVVLATLRTP